MGRWAPEELAIIITQVLLCKLIRAGSRTASFLGAETAESSAETAETAPAELFWSGVAKCFLSNIPKTFQRQIQLTPLFCLFCRGTL